MTDHATTATTTTDETPFDARRDVLRARIDEAWARIVHASDPETVAATDTTTQ